jgi:signal transduction histidine kinase
VVVRDHKAKVEVVIKDEGIGIPEDLKPFIFEKKSRASRPGSMERYPTALGSMW